MARRLDFAARCCVAEQNATDWFAPLSLKGGGTREDRSGLFYDRGVARHSLDAANAIALLKKANGPDVTSRSIL